MMGVDLGYSVATTVVIVKPNDTSAKFTFASIDEGTDFEEVVCKVADMMKRHNIHPDDLCSPGNPSFEKAVRNIFKIS